VPGCAARIPVASLVFIVFVYVYVVIVNKGRTWLWITGNFVYGSRGCVNHKPAELTRTGTRSLGKLFDDQVNRRCYQDFAHKVPGGLYKSCPEGAVDNFLGVGWRYEAARAASRYVMVRGIPALNVSPQRLASG
jgi:hypothetical protein